MHSYWIGIMAVAFVLAMGIWLLLLFNADRHPGGRRQESLPHREVIGGEFDAVGGGRQVMPLPGQPVGPASPGQSAVAGQRQAVPAQRPASPAGPGPAEVPGQGAPPASERAPAEADRT